MVQYSLLKKFEYESFDDLDELIRESLHMILVAVAIVVWAWAEFNWFANREFSLHSHLILVFVWTISGFSYHLSKKRLRWGVGIYLAGLITSITVTAYVFQNSATLYLYMLVVLIVATITNLSVMLSTTVVMVGLMVLVAWISPAVNFLDIASSIVLVLLTALISWASAQRLYTTLAWALNMTEVAQKNAREAQQHRAELKRVLRSLDEAYVRLERTNEALVMAQEATAKAYRFKAEFVANVSHELRTPLNLITGFAGMMVNAPESYGGKPLPGELRGDLMAIYQSSRHLSNLIDDVLDLSRIDAGKMPITKEPADLGRVARQAADMVRGLVEARQLHFELQIPDELPPFYIDRTRIRQVLLNLLTNASRFTDRGFIRVCIRLQEQEAVITVEDSGRGISKDMIAKAFESFSQLEAGQAHSGSGLGLAVSKRFIELHGGRMWIDSKPGVGTTIGFTLPRMDEGGHHIRASAPSIVYKKDSKPLVLVLSNESRVLLVFRRYIEGFQFEQAGTLDEARKVVKEMFPSVVIADEKWDHQTDALKQEINLPAHVPLIIGPLPGMQRLGLVLNAADYLPKPVTQEDLHEALMRLPRAPQSILIVDDNPQVVRLLTRFVKAYNPDMKIFKAFNGKRCLEIARTRQPDVIILDLVIPEMSGYEVLTSLTGDEELSKIQVVVISARNIAQEATPLRGEFSLVREAGLTLTQMLGLLRAILPEVTQLAVMAPDNAATLQESQSAEQVL